MFEVIWRDPSGYRRVRFADRAEAEAFADNLAARGTESDLRPFMPCSCPECDLRCRDSTTSTRGSRS